MADHAPAVAMEAVLKPSSDLPEDMLKIRGYDFNQGVDLKAVLKSYLTTGFQASSLGLAIQEINRMVRKGRSFQGRGAPIKLFLTDTDICFSLRSELPIQILFN